MILPIVAYGDPVLRRECEEIDEISSEIKELISNMFETMYNAQGVGLAAPQIGQNLRLFLVDASPFAEDEDNPDREFLSTFKKVFINPEIVDESGDEWGFEEGCLSIPNIREEVTRQPKIRMIYQDENMVEHDEAFEGMAARIIQHEYDHIEGVLFTDHLKPLKKRFLQKKLNNISKGKTRVAYRMRFPAKKR